MTVNNLAEDKKDEDRHIWRSLQLQKVILWSHLTKHNVSIHREENITFKICIEQKPNFFFFFLILSYTVWEPEFHPWVRKIHWRREWLPTPVFLRGEFHGQRSLAGYIPWLCKESDTTEQLSLTHVNVLHYWSYRDSIRESQKGVQGCLFYAHDQSSEKIVIWPGQVADVQLTQRKVLQSKTHSSMSLKIQSGNCVLLLLHGQWFHLSGLSPRERSW